MNDSNTGVADLLPTHFATEKAVGVTHVCANVCWQIPFLHGGGRGAEGSSAPVMPFNYRCFCTKNLDLLLFLDVRMKISWLCWFFILPESAPFQ